MKKILVLVCVVVIAISSLPAAHAAGGLQSVADIINGKKTDTSENSPNPLDVVSDTNAFEYVERFTSNWDKCKYEYFAGDEDIDFERIFSTWYIADPLMSIVSSFGGTIIVDEALNIRCVSNVLEDFTDDGNKYTNLLKCIVMMSVLEYSAAEQSSMDLLSQLVGSKSTIEASTDTFLEIYGGLSLDVIRSAIAGDRMMVYSGKSFNYYVSYMKSNNEDGSLNQEWLVLEAFAKQHE